MTGTRSPPSVCTQPVNEFVGPFVDLSRLDQGARGSGRGAFFDGRLTRVMALPHHRREG